MTRLLGALLAGALTFSPPLALADDNDSKPVSKMETQESKAALVAAQAKWNSMTTEERNDAKKAARAKKLSEATALDMIANGSMQYSSRQPFTHPDGTPMVGDFARPKTPEQREADARKAAADSEVRLKKQAEQKKSEHP